MFLNVLPGHRAVYIGVHVPFSKESRRRHRHRGHKHHHRRRKDKDSDREDGRESPSYGKRSGSSVLGKCPLMLEGSFLEILFLNRHFLLKIIFL